MKLHMSSAQMLCLICLISIKGSSESTGVVQLTKKISSSQVEEEVKNNNYTFTFWRSQRIQCHTTGGIMNRSIFIVTEKQASKDDVIRNYILYKLTILDDIRVAMASSE